MKRKEAVEWLRAETLVQVEALLVERFGTSVRGRAEARLFCLQVAEVCGLEIRGRPEDCYCEANPKNCPVSVLVAYELRLREEIEALRAFERTIESADAWEREVKRRAEAEKRDEHRPKLKVEIG